MTQLLIETRMSNEEVETKNKRSQVKDGSGGQVILQHYSFRSPVFKEEEPFYHAERRILQHAVPAPSLVGEPFLPLAFTSTHGHDDHIFRLSEDDEHSQIAKKQRTPPALVRPSHFGESGHDFCDVESSPLSVSHFTCEHGDYRRSCSTSGNDNDHKNMRENIIKRKRSSFDDDQGLGLVTKTIVLQAPEREAVKKREESASYCPNESGVVQYDCGVAFDRRFLYAVPTCNGTAIGSRSPDPLSAPSQIHMLHCGFVLSHQMSRRSITCAGARKYDQAVALRTYEETGMKHPQPQPNELLMHSGKTDKETSLSMQNEQSHVHTSILPNKVRIMLDKLSTLSWQENRRDQNLKSFLSAVCTTPDFSDVHIYNQYKAPTTLQPIWSCSPFSESNAYIAIKSRTYTSISKTNTTNGKRSGFHDEGQITTKSLAQFQSNKQRIPTSQECQSDNFEESSGHCTIPSPCGTSPTSPLKAKRISRKQTRYKRRNSVVIQRSSLHTLHMSLVGVLDDDKKAPCSSNTNSSGEVVSTMTKSPPPDSLWSPTEL